MLKTVKYNKYSNLAFFTICLVCTAKVDLGILIDGSGSIEQTGPGNFKRELNFVKQIVSAFEVSRDGTHVGIIIFSSDAKVCM